MMATGVDSASIVDEAARVLRAGGVVILPTDTVYGLAALPSVPGATAKIFSLKARSEQQPLAVLVADRRQAEDLLELPEGSTRRFREWTRRHWPGALTIVGNRSAAARALELGAGPDTVGVRCPDHSLVRTICSVVGPLATTSANRSGDPTPTGAAEAAASLDGPVDLVIDGGEAGTVASTVVDLTGPVPRLLRVGAIEPDDLDPSDFGPSVR